MFITHEVRMNVLLSLDREEIEVLMDHHAGKIGQVDDAECERVMKRIDQLSRTVQPDPHAYIGPEAA
jgi:hypothetical protein